MAPALGAAIIGGGMGVINDFISRDANRRDAAKQFQRTKELMDKSYIQQMQMWKDTNYNAQKAELEKAGLNPGLLYGMSGGGATTTGSGGSGSASMAAPVNSKVVEGTGMGIQLGLMNAQKENIEADTALKQADAAKTAGVDTKEAGARIENLMQGLDNLREDYEVKRLQQTMMNIENYEKQSSQEDRLNYIKYETQSALRSLQTLKNEGKISDATIGERIQIVQQQAIGAMLQNQLTQSNIQVNDQQIKASANKIMQDWEGLSNELKKTRLQEIMTEYGTTIDPWTEKAIDAILGTGGKLIPIKHQMLKK